MALAAWALGARCCSPCRARASRSCGAVAARRRPSPGRAAVYGLSLLGAQPALGPRSTPPRCATCARASPRCSCPTGVLVALALRRHARPRASYVVGDVTAARTCRSSCCSRSRSPPACTAARDRGRLRPVLALSVLGFALAAVYAVVGAPDVALVAVVVETVLTLVFVGVFSRLPPLAADRAGGQRRRRRAAQRRRRACSRASARSRRSGPRCRARPSASSDAAEQIAPARRSAHGGDVVTVILADFRGLDTMVEITVLAVAIIGVASLLRRGRAVVSVVIEVVAPRLLGPALMRRAGAHRQGLHRRRRRLQRRRDRRRWRSRCATSRSAGARRSASLPILRHAPAIAARRAAGRAGGRVRRRSLFGDPPFTHLPGAGRGRSCTSARSS